MKAKPKLTIPCILMLACAPNDEVELPVDDGPVVSGGDEASTLPPLDPEEPPVPIENNVCLTTVNEPYQGIWHQCGGSFDIELTGDALGTAINESISIDFGPGVEGDSYGEPRVAACCGEFDFERPFSEQREYAENCLYDSIQQFCSALPYYLWDMAKVAGDNNKIATRDLLNNYGNQLSTSEKQYECIDSLWADGPTDPYYYAITSHSWNAIADVWVKVVVAEINDLYLPEDPAEWVTCESIFENDDTVLPDTGGPVLDTLLLDSGSLSVSGLDLQLALTPEPTSALVIGSDARLGALQLHGAAARLAGLTVERWRLGSLRSVPMKQRDDGALVVSAGALAMIGALVVDGETITTMAYNSTELVLWTHGRGWQIEPFTVVYTSATGDAWTLQTSELQFVAR